MTKSFIFTCFFCLIHCVILISQTDWQPLYSKILHNVKYPEISRKVESTASALFKVRVSNTDGKVVNVIVVNRVKDDAISEEVQRIASILKGEKILLTLSNKPVSKEIESYLPIKFIIEGTKTSEFRQKPIYILDGVDVPHIDGLPSEAIESVNVLKDEDATNVYGEKGKNGVVEIKLRQTDRMYVFLNEIVVSGKSPVAKN